MSTSALLLLLAITSATLLTVKAAPVHNNVSDSRHITNTTMTDRTPKQPNRSRYIATLQIYRRLVRVWQTIWFLLKAHVRIIKS